VLREMCGPGLGAQLLFVPEAIWGMGGGAKRALADFVGSGVSDPT
jgi:hypothetical protein